MARDIEDFLRRAAERRQQKAGGGAPRPKPANPPRQPAQQQPARQRPVEPTVVEATIAPKRLVQKRRDPKPKLREGSVADHVSSHINTSSIGDHAERLGSRISAVHDQVDSRIHQNLDHDISKIDDSPTITGLAAPATTNRAGDLRKVLSNPQSIRQAIMLAEILKRPNFD